MQDAGSKEKKAPRDVYVAPLCLGQRQACPVAPVRNSSFRCDEQQNGTDAQNDEGKTQRQGCSLA